MSASPPSAAPSLAEIAWLAGLWDGEGSVGAFVRASGRPLITPQIQVHMTHEETISRVAEILCNIGAPAKCYRSAEKNGRYRDSFHISVTRTSSILAVANAVIPYAVTKALQWGLVKELCEARIARHGINEDTGWMRRGGAAGWEKPYTERELELAQALRAANASANTRSAMRMGIETEWPTSA